MSTTAADIPDPTRLTPMVGGGGIPADPPAVPGSGTDRPGVAAQVWLRLAWSIGVLMGSFLSLLSASLAVAVEVSYRAVDALIEWRPFPMSLDITIALFLVLLFSILAGLLCLVYRYITSLGERMFREIRVAQDLDSTALNAADAPSSPHHLV